MRVSGKEWPSFLNRQLFQLRLKLAGALSPQIIVDGDTQEFVFKCRSYTEYKRVVSLFAKEKGTIKWIKENFEAGDVFYDIGANIGLYSIYAAARIGESGKVASFEPHPANTHRLMENIVLNGFTNRITVLSVALHDSEGFFNFNIRTLNSGSSMSQLSSTIDGNGQSFSPVISSLKYSCAVDHLVNNGQLPPPNHIKIDVDGNEHLVLGGMKGLLTSNSAPRTIQVEVNHQSGKALEAFMNTHGYELFNRHYTHNGEQLIKKGADPAQIAHNVIFRQMK